MAVKNLPQTMQKQVLQVVGMAEKIRVTNADEYLEAVNHIAVCKDVDKKIVDFFKEPKAAADKAHKAVVQLEKWHRQPIVNAMRLIESVALPWKQEEDRKAKLAELERQRQRQIELDQRRQVENNIASMFGIENDAPVMIARPQPPAQTPKVAGVGTRKTWKVKIVAPDQVTRRYCSPDPVLINSKVRNTISLLGSAPTVEQIESLAKEIGGIEIYEEEAFVGTR